MPFTPRPRKETHKYSARAEIARLLNEPLVLRMCPQARDPKALIEHGVATMVRLCESENAKVASDAAQWLVAFGQNLQSLKRGAGQNQMEIVAELRTLYAKALPQGRREAAGEPLVEVVDAEETAG